MTYINSGYGLSHPANFQTTQIHPTQPSVGNYTSFPILPGSQQTSGILPIGNLQNLTQNFLGSIHGGFGSEGPGQSSFNTGGPLLIQTGGGKGGKKGQNNISLIGGYGQGGQNIGNLNTGGPLLLQTGGGKGGKKGQNNISLIGGYGQGGQNIGNFNTGGPLLLQTGGGKGGKKGQNNIAVIGGYGPQPGGNTINNFYQPGLPFGINPQPSQGWFGGAPLTPGGSFGQGFPVNQQPGNIYINNPGNFDNNQPSQFPSGGYTPLILQTGGGKGGKKGQSNIAITGGYGLGNQGFGNFSGGPLFLQTGGGKGGKKGLSTISFSGGYGIGNFPAHNTTNNFFQTPTNTFGYQNDSGSPNSFGYQNPGQISHNPGSFGHGGISKYH